MYIHNESLTHHYYKHHEFRIDYFQNNDQFLKISMKSMQITNDFIKTDLFCKEHVQFLYILVALNQKEQYFHSVSIIQLFHMVFVVDKEKSNYLLR